jgi:mono/diheme cytochrome c family protein
MKSAGLIFMFLLFAVPSNSQTNGGSVEQKQQAPSIVILPSNKSLTPAQLEGKKLFLERCSVCHLPGMASYSAYGPVLGSKIVLSLDKATVRDRIMHGSARMPGFQYTLKDNEIDDIVEYLKIVDSAASK